MAANPWTLAFKRAVDVEEEGAKDFVDIIAQHAQKKQRLIVKDHSSEQHEGTGESGNILSPDLETDLKIEDGQSHLHQLSKFVMETAKPKLSRSKDGTENIAHPESTSNVSQERDMVEVCGRQMCRAWLKHTYLMIGNPCKDGEACLRKHEVTCKPEHLYKDYSFKGLSAKQRKTIMDKLKAESI